MSITRSNVTQLHLRGALCRDIVSGRTVAKVEVGVDADFGRSADGQGITVRVVGTNDGIGLGGELLVLDLTTGEATALKSALTAAGA